jgi:hypothetical protein
MSLIVRAALGSAMWLWVSCQAQAADNGELHFRVQHRPAGGVSLSVNNKVVELDAATVAQIMSIRFTVECWVEPGCQAQRAEPFEGTRRILPSAELAQTLSNLGEQILVPFAQEIDRATVLNIEIPPELVKFSIDALQLGGEPLYIRKPIVYTIGQPAAAVKPAPRLTASATGVLISDRTSDPERAVFRVREFFSRSIMVEADEVDGIELQRHAPVDFAVISLHGRAGYDEADVMALPSQQELSPELIGSLRPRLVYLDSCNLGLSLRYLRALQLAGARYVLAPILSNEAGNSSTRTIEAFFRELALGNDPIVALHSAKRQLYAHYISEDPRAVLWRAFPFRIYELH